jgi:1-acyl-sn-glycerol-3-phosphate acyltransferase
MLRLVSWAGFFILYRKRLVLNRHNLRFDGPAIVISNHPSTLTDVLNIGIHIRQEMFFLANYSLFKNPVSNWLLTRLYCIPIKRKEDVQEGETRNNDQGFQQSYRHLEQNGILFIAPEGVSWINRFVRPFKTGTARIAFGAESRHNWNLDIKIIPVGLSYSAPWEFRSEVVINAGAPVYPRDWQAAWQKDPEAAADQLTAHLEETIRKLTIHTRDEAGEQLITRLESILSHTHPLDQTAAFYRSQQLTETCLNNPKLEATTREYFESLDRWGLTDEGVAAAADPHANTRNISDGLRLALGFPFFLLGYACWFLPCYLPWLLNKKMNIYIGYSTTVKFLAGLFVFPLAFWALYRVAFYISNETIIAFGALITAIFLGNFTERFLDVQHRFRAGQKAATWAEAHGSAFGILLQLRQEIVDTCTALLSQTSVAKTM